MTGSSDLVRASDLIHKRAVDAQGVGVWKGDESDTAGLEDSPFTLHVATFANPEVALGVVAWLRSEVRRAQFRENQQEKMNASLRPEIEPYPCYYDPETEKAIEVAQTYLGGES